LAKKQEGVPENVPTVLKRHSMDLLVRLSNDEQLDRGKRLAAAMGEEADIVARHEHQKRQMKAELAESASKIAALRTIVATGQELRTVDVEDRADHVRGRWFRVRLDNLETVGERKLTEEESQVPMAGVL
jgi:hypothetical protein